MMMTVRETFTRVERQCLGLGLPCPQPHHWFCQVTDALQIQYEIAGAGGGVWHLTVRLNDCELAEGPVTRPTIIVRASAEDWLAIWSGDEPAATLVKSGRLSVAPADLAATAAVDLPYLGVLGPLAESDGSAAGGATPPYTEEDPAADAYPCIVRDWYPHALEHVTVSRIDRGQLAALVNGEWANEFRPILERDACVRAPVRWLRSVLSRLIDDKRNRNTVELYDFEAVRLISLARRNPRFFRCLTECGLIEPDRSQWKG